MWICLSGLWGAGAPFTPSDPQCVTLSASEGSDLLEGSWVLPARVEDGASRQLCGGVATLAAVQHVARWEFRPQRGCCVCSWACAQCVTESRPAGRGPGPLWRIWPHRGARTGHLEGWGVGSEGPCRSRGWPGWGEGRSIWEAGPTVPENLLEGLPPSCPQTLAHEDPLTPALAAPHPSIPCFQASL